MSYLVPRLRTPQQSYGPSLGVKKSRKCDLATDLTLPKAIQEQQTQEQRSTNYSDLPRTFLGLFAHVLERLSRDVAGTEPGPSPPGQAPKPVSWRRRPLRSGIGAEPAFLGSREAVRSGENLTFGHGLGLFREGCIVGVKSGVGDFV
jgi:hypothetical protein